ncbi:MAG: pirin family protein [Pseudomonadota bacterium]
MSQIDQIISPRERDLGSFSVRRVLPYMKRRLVGPFVFFDHMGPADFKPGEGMDVRPHPHIGLATVTYLFSGEIFHRDSLGYKQAIQPGAVNWMVAGKGIVHSERTPDTLRETGFHIEGIQSWIALPMEHEQAEPSFVHHPENTLPFKQLDGVNLRLIAGTAFGMEAPVKVFSPMFYVDVKIEEGRHLDLPDFAERAVYVVSGRAQVCGEQIEPGSMAVLKDNSGDASMTALEDSHIMLLGGESLEGERTIFWNFVHSDPAMIEAAKDAWREERFAAVPGESERIPLPEG